MIPYPNKLTDPSLAVSETDFLRRAMLEQTGRGYFPLKPIENNAGSELLMLAEFAEKRGATTLETEVVKNACWAFLMQLDLIGQRLNPGSSWINTAVEAGWRATANGFRKVS